jgi:hypothetical protein
MRVKSPLAVALGCSAILSGNFSYGDVLTPPGIYMETRVSGPLGIALGSRGGIAVKLAPTVNPILTYNASGMNTTAQGAVASGTTALSTNYALNYFVGESIVVTGAGVSGANLLTTVAAVPSAYSITLATNASTTVTAGTVYTIGSISASSNILTVASTTGWAVGYGIDVAGAGAAGADLITSVTAVSPTGLTIAANASTTVTNAKINFDDTSAINAALATQNNVILDARSFNITSALNIAYPQAVSCAGILPPNGTVIFNRSAANNMWNITVGNFVLTNCAFLQASEITATGGYGINLGTSSGSITGGLISWIYENGLYHDVFLGPNVTDVYIEHSSFQGSLGELLTLNNPVPAGGNWFIANAFGCNSNSPQTGVDDISSDTSIWLADNIQSCDPMVSLNTSSASGQQFIGGTFEGSNLATYTRPLVPIGNGAQRNSFIGTEFETDQGQGAVVVSGRSTQVTLVGLMCDVSITGGCASANGTAVVADSTTAGGGTSPTVHSLFPGQVQPSIASVKYQTAHDNPPRRPWRDPSRRRCRRSPGHGRPG